MLSVSEVPTDMKCPSCMDHTTDAVMQCTGGHIACRRCADRTFAVSGRCMLCRGDMHKPGGQWIPALVANQVTRDCVVPCGFSGCSAMSDLTISTNTLSISWLFRYVFHVSCCAAAASAVMISDMPALAPRALSTQAV